MIKIKAALIAIACGVAAIPALSEVRPELERATQPETAAGDRKPFERRYVLAKAQAEVLALLLRLDPPADTTIRTEADKEKRGVAVVISGPPKVHYAVAPLVALLAPKKVATPAETMQLELDVARRTAEKRD